MMNSETASINPETLPLAVTALATGRVPPADLDDFVRLALRELATLHEGNYARFRL
jgi:hypothetical protein